MPLSLVLCAQDTQSAGTPFAMGTMIINFDGLADKDNGFNVGLQDGYDGFNWSNMNAINIHDPATEGQPGFRNALHSGNSVAYNPAGDDCGFSCETHFNLKS